MAKQFEAFGLNDLCIESRGIAEGPVSEVLYCREYSSAGEIAEFWMVFIDLVRIILNLLRGSREGHWSLHLQAIRDMIPWCFAYDKMNYAQYLSHYYAEMTHVEIEYLE